VRCQASGLRSQVASSSVDFSEGSRLTLET
jgi:hypothetical protein